VRTRAPAASKQAENGEKVKNSWPGPGKKKKKQVLPATQKKTQKSIKEAGRVVQKRDETEKGGQK